MSSHFLNVRGRTDARSPGGNFRLKFYRSGAGIPWNVIRSLNSGGGWRVIGTDSLVALIGSLYVTRNIRCFIPNEILFFSSGETEFERDRERERKEKKREEGREKRILKQSLVRASEIEGNKRRRRKIRRGIVEFDLLFEWVEWDEWKEYRKIHEKVEFSPLLEQIRRGIRLLRGHLIVNTHVSLRDFFLSEGCWYSEKDILSGYFFDHFSSVWKIARDETTSGSLS